MKRILLILFILFSVAVYAAGGIKQMSQDIIRFGSSALGNRELVFDQSPDGNSAKLVVDPSDDTMDIASSGLSIASSVYVAGSFTANSTAVINGTIKMGDGTAADQLLTYDHGAGASNNYIGYSAALDSLVFTKNGLEKKFGTGSGSGSGGTSVLKNGSFEDQLLNWTNSGGAFLQVAFTAGESDLEGNENYATFDASAAAQYIETDLYTTHSPIRGGGCEIGFRYQGGSTGYTAQLINGSSDVQVAFSLSTSDTTWREVTWAQHEPVTCPDQMKLRIISSEDAPLLKIDDVYLGNVRGVISLSPEAHFVGSLTWQDVATCQWGNTVQAWTSYPLDAQCDDKVRLAKGRVVSDLSIGASDGQFPKIKLKNVEQGVLKLEAKGRFYITTGNGCSWRFSDGTQASNGNLSGNGVDASGSIIGELHYDSFQSEVEIEIQSRSETGSNCRLYSNSDYGNLKISAYSFPDGEDTVAASIKKQDFYVAAKITGANISRTASVSPVGIENGGLTLTSLSGSAKIPCSSTNAPTGDTCSVGNESVGIVIETPVSGYYRVCASFVTFNSAGYYGVRIVETPIDAQTVLQTGEEYGGNSATAGVSVKVCGKLLLNKGERALRLFHSSTSATTYYADEIASSMGRAINFTAELVAEYVNQPRFLGQVTSARSNGEELMKCKTGGGGSPTLGANCNDWVDSVASGGTGRVVYTFSEGYDVDKMNCDANNSTNSGSYASSTISCNVGKNTATDKLYSYCKSGGGTDSNSDRTIFCWQEK